MSRKITIAGLDIGSNKITGVVATKDLDTNTLKMEHVAVSDCKGLKGGVVIDIQQTSDSIQQVLHELEDSVKKELDNIYIAIRGYHLESFTNHGAYNISRVDKEITADDIYFAIENAKSVPVKNDNDIINTIPQNFSVDKQQGIPNPEGMEGSLLEVDLHVTTGSSTHLNNLLRAIERIGYKVDVTLYGLIALGDCALTQEEKDLGALIIDIGGDTMSVGLYFDGGLRFSRDIPYGADLITRDIAYGVRTSRTNAKNLKEEYAVAHPSYLGDEEEIKVEDLDGKTTNSIKKTFLLDVVQPRVEELFTEVKRALDRSGYSEVPAIGVLTGGGSVMPGMKEMCSEVLGLKEVRSGSVQRDLMISDETFFAPEYSTAVSLVVYESERNHYGDYSRVGVQTSGSVLGKVSKMFKKMDFFGG
ncbi:MAG: cell division protein FtsA [Elusimicrobiaceae bacterium]|nr:cell division protein FtsA [Elusimicrobiaceae bacterium]MBT3954604.1 cell division protein FtsA [Elusimicrobiaceae bacterium]MBT4007912.1 cell division protein FtsA [Elusimicrobiaceae bacterium]MBT4403115.1 cell division protein FtsA [Elusimicrobiaceae bacterium]MBT4439926.1 cell division protein FtsA [Elusimicrobiaceae bacterium]